MRIVESNVALSAQRQFSREQSQSLSLRYEPPRPAAPSVSDQVEISSAARLLDEQEEAVNNDPKLRLIKSLLEAMLGHEIKLGYGDKANTDKVSSSNTPIQEHQTGGFNLEFHAHEQEAEQTQFQASGVIKTADGQEISFEAELNLSRRFSQSIDLSIATGSAAKPKKDPLVLNYAAPAATLSDKTFLFDLDAQGSKENIHQLNAGSAYLALDKNQDGKINNGKELFGTQNGNGFADLAQYDGDQNGWIDEGDQVYADLKLWLKDATGKDELKSLHQMKIGAIYLGYARGDFDLNNSQNQNYGQIRSSGVYLHSNGSVGSVQQLDLSI